MVQEHERGLGGWHAEWETLPEIAVLASGALDQIVHDIEGLEVDERRMRRNLDLTHGSIQASSVASALAQHLGRSASHELVADAHRRAVQQGRTLRDVLGQEPAVREALPPAELDRLFEPSEATGVTDALIDRALAARSRT